MATTIVFPLPKFGVIKLDACKGQGHSRGADIAKHKVEEGSDITDHVRPGPPMLTITGIVAYAPPRDLLAVALGAFLGDGDRHQRAFDRVMQAIEDSELVTIETTRKVYKNMAIKSVDAPMEASTGNDFIFTMQVEEVRFVSAQTALIPKDAFGKAIKGAAKAPVNAKALKTQRQAVKPTAKGSAPKKTPTAAQSTRGASVLSTLTGFGG